jgi:FkbM family methyltransferase
MISSLQHAVAMDVVPYVADISGRGSIRLTKMPFVSYAQNCEDVMLRRALRRVERGFYVDVGANDPVYNSVTKAFYERGWRGINIEPVRSWFNKVQADRAEDVNLEIAVAEVHSTTAKLYEVKGTGLSTIRTAVAQRHAAEGGYEVEQRTVATATLTSILDRYSEDQIHFLNIDAEGAEGSVLQGLDLSKHRPWIVLAESTLPNTQIESYEEWEPLLTACGYHFVYFDGLNRFYVADEHCALDENFRVPPNVFDDFISVTTHDLARQLDATKAQLQYVKRELAFTAIDLQVMQQNAVWRALKRIRNLKGLSFLTARSRVRSE